MADDTGETEDERTIELFTVAAIYPELNINPLDSYSASILIEVAPIKPLTVIFSPFKDGDHTSGLLTPPKSDETDNNQRVNKESRSDSLAAEGRAHDIHQLSHLPPISLKINLQTGYPNQKPPLFRLETESPWIPRSKLNELRDAGSSIWEDLGRTQVVFAYIDYLREAAERGFDLVKKDEENLEISQSLKIPLLDFDLQGKRKKFEQETFECGVCLEPKKGLVCHRLLLCSHVFCVACLQDYLNTCIIEGDVTNVKCMAPNCISDPKSSTGEGGGQKRKRRRKQDRTLEPSELLQIPLSQEQVQRYIKLKRKAKLESDRTTIYCPRQWCQGPARAKRSAGNSDEDSDSESEKKRPPAYDPNVNQDLLPPPKERLAICEDCTFAFCKVCKVSWHGEFVSCFPRKQAELTAEERASENYIKQHTSPCPTCDARCQKTMGCNHMICFKCNSHFCYLCSAWLDQDNPYQHFNSRSNQCYMRLWELEEGEGVEVGRDRGWDDPEVIIGAVDDSDSGPDADEPPPPVPPAPEPLDLPHRINEGLNAWGVGANRDLGPPAPPPPPRALAAPRARPRGRGGFMPGQARDQRRAPVQGLQRFLQMVHNDEEDEWDSDEMAGEEGSDDDAWEIPVRR